MNSFAVAAKLFFVMARTKDFDENEVLTRAMNIFWCRGYNATSMEDLVSGLGISRSSLYGTYTDKHTLYIKALENYQQMGGAKMQEILDTPAPAKETIQKLIEYAIYGTTDKQKGAGCFMLNAQVEVAAVDEAVSNIICKKDQQMEEIYCQVIEQGKKNGEIKNKQDARVLAKFISNAIKGMQVSAKSTTDLSAFDDIITLTVSVLD